MRRGSLAAAALVLFLFLLAAPALAFSDVSPDAYYARDVDGLASRGIIQGFPDGTFRPGLPVTRQQFAKMIVRALDLPVSEADICPFPDVTVGGPSNLYPDNYVAVAAARGITNGTGPSTFSPFAEISGAQAVTMVVRATQSLYPGLLVVPPENTPTNWGRDFDPVHGPNAQIGHFNGLFARMPVALQLLGPWYTMYRGQIALVLSNLLGLLEDSDAPTGQPVEVIRVIDGDTIEVSLEGETVQVRLIGIDAPETGEPFAAEATATLEELIQGRDVTLEYDVEKTDQYGRLLAYVFVSEGEVRGMVNQSMVLFGLATAYAVPPNVTYADLFESLQRAAQVQGAGMWGAPAGSPLSLVEIHYDAAGSDNDNLNDEYVVFRPVVTRSLVGYSVEDEAGNRYDFPDRIFPIAEAITLHTGSGTDSRDDLYWGQIGAVWNNDGDTVRVLDPAGHIVLSQSY